MNQYIYIYLTLNGNIRLSIDRVIMPEKYGDRFAQEKGKKYFVIAEYKTYVPKYLFRIYLMKQLS